MSSSSVMPLPIFGKSRKSPADVVKNLQEALVAVEKDDAKSEKALKDVSKWLQSIKNIIYESETEESTTEDVAQLSQEVYSADIISMLIKNLPKLEFESRKDVVQIFSNLLRRQIGTRSPTVEYLAARPEILISLLLGYENVDIAIACGQILRECIRHDELAKIILQHELFYKFFEYVEIPAFDIASDAFATFKDLITRHKSLCAEFLEANYDVFFANYQKLLESDNYITRRQSLKLLGELLLDRHNVNIMTRYVSDAENLILMMRMLCEKGRNIQFEAFHVFKIFVASPNKPRPVAAILSRNREKLIDFLGQFQNERTDDEQFNEEKAYLIKQINEMKN